MGHSKEIYEWFSKRILGEISEGMSLQDFLKKKIDGGMSEAMHARFLKGFFGISEEIPGQILKKVLEENFQKIPCRILDRMNE